MKEATLTLTKDEISSLMNAGENVPLSDEQKESYDSGFKKLLKASQSLSEDFEVDFYV